MRIVCLVASILFLPVILLGSGCERPDRRGVEIARLQAQIESDLAFLVRDAETADPSRTNLKVKFVESSIMDIRETTNPERPWVGHVRIKWKFEYDDGRPLGFSAWDYVYALDKTGRWFKADEVQEGDPVPKLPVPPSPPEPDPAVSPVAVRAKPA